jgi:apolipoprotein N-acyltransferase
MKFSPQNHLQYLAFSLLSAGFFILSWQPFSLPLLFVAFVPLLLVLQRVTYPWQGFMYSFITFFTWNLGSTFWLWNATLPGAIAAFVINTLLMCLPCLVYLKMRANQRKALVVFVAAWLSFEYVHHTWEFSWPWLSLGNAFAPYPFAVQWYEYTGVVGGSLWILWANKFVFECIQPTTQSIRPKLLSGGFWLMVFPLFTSWYVGKQYQFKGLPIKVMVVQPNIDPYGKFEDEPVAQVQKMMDLAEQEMDSSVQLICLPETALQGGLDENYLLQEPTIQVLKTFITKHPNVAILSGADSYIFYPVGQKTFTARAYNDSLYYDCFNTALLVTQNSDVPVYHKAKLVPGVESMPYQQLLGFLGTAAIDLGGTSGSLGRNKEAANFTIGHALDVAPVICYESVFGEYVASYVAKGAGLLCIITNDGWWGNTPGYTQHFDYARLRAIETRRYIARSANTGLSGFIDDRGNVLSKTTWWQPAVQKQMLYYNTTQTFYVKNASIIELIPLLIFGLLLLQNWRKPL